MRLLLILFPIFALACQFDQPAAWRQQDLEISIEVLGEGGNYYSVAWDDTIGMRDSHLLYNRPLELWCHVLSVRNDTLGYYRGMSTPMTFAYFETTDSLVILQFAKAFNHFSDAFTSEQARRRFWEKHREPVEYESIRIDLRDQVGEKLNYELGVRED
jgi:hypothetical protein